MSDITYQNKDITSKVFAEKFKGKSLRVYGINVPDIKQILPTNVPIIRANELRIDNVFLLEDDTIAIIDYESAYKKENKHKYIEYINHVVEYYSKEWKRNIQVRMIVIYTADVKRDETSDVLDAGCLKLEIESSYLSELNSEEIAQNLNQKINEGKSLTDEELMQFIILPLAYEGNTLKNVAINNSIKLAAKVEDEETKIFMLTGIAVFTDKVILPQYANQIREMLSMTKVGILFEDDKKKALKEKEKSMIIKMIKADISKGQDIDEQEALSMCEFLSLSDIRNIIASLITANPIV